MSSDSRGFVSPPKWVFDDKVAPVLEDMMGRQIPGFDDLRDTIMQFLRARGKTFGWAERPPRVLDVGCGAGGIFDLALWAWPEGGVYWGIDNSKAMIEYCNKRWSTNDSSSIQRAWKRVFQFHDIGSSIPLEEIGIGDADVVFCVLTLHFIDPHFRKLALKKMREAMNRDAILIIVEKIEPDYHWRISQVITEMHRAHKRHNELSTKEILDKEKSLNGVLVPWTRQQNELMFEDIGFESPHVFWANTTFMGWMMFK